MTGQLLLRLTAHAYGIQIVLKYNIQQIASETHAHAQKILASFWCSAIYFKGTAVHVPIYMLQNRWYQPHLLHIYTERTRAPRQTRIKIVIMVLKNTKNINFTDGAAIRTKRTLCGRARVVLIFKPTHSRC